MKNSQLPPRNHRFVGRVFAVSVSVLMLAGLSLSALSISSAGAAPNNRPCGAGTVTGGGGMGGTSGTCPGGTTNAGTGATNGCGTSGAGCTFYCWTGPSAWTGTVPAGYGTNGQPNGCGSNDAGPGTSSGGATACYSGNASGGGGSGSVAISCPTDSWLTCTGGGNRINGASGYVDCSQPATPPPGGPTTTTSIPGSTTTSIPATTTTVPATTTTIPVTTTSTTRPPQGHNKACGAGPVTGGGGMGGTSAPCPGGTTNAGTGATNGCGTSGAGCNFHCWTGPNAWTGSVPAGYGINGQPFGCGSNDAAPGGSSGSVTGCYSGSASGGGSSGSVTTSCPANTWMFCSGGGNGASTGSVFCIKSTPPAKTSH